MAPETPAISVAHPLLYLVGAVGLWRHMQGALGQDAPVFSCTCLGNRTNAPGLLEGGKPGQWFMGCPSPPPGEGNCTFLDLWQEVKCAALSQFLQGKYWRGT